MSTREELIRAMEKAGLYSKLPQRLEAEFGSRISPRRKDVFGIGERWKAIKMVVGERKLGDVQDLGGHSGFFSISAVDEGMADSARVYDINTEALEIGRLLALELGISDKVEYIRQPIDLGFIKQLAASDTIFCLNLIHHAGSNFDQAKVESVGWGSYAEEWLHELRNKFKFAVIGVGFKKAKPVLWDVPIHERPMAFSAIVRAAGWRILYDANVQDQHVFGARFARGLRCCGFMDRAMTVIHEVRNRFASPGKAVKRGRYHLYILE